MGGQDYGAHGIFDNEAKDTRVQLWASQHHGAVAAIVAGLGLGRRAQR